MGLIADIYRSDYDSALNAFAGRSRVTVTNVPGPFEPTDAAPAARLTRGPGGDLILVPELTVVEPSPDDDEKYGPALIGPMFGGTFATSSDSRFREASGTRAALPVHDRYETPEQYEGMSR